ncbi:MAG TPA: PEP-CTERM sorting domain-containing protein [Lacipirellulaceae bacterium]|nr:PEP-CTERM sorting domain-containing protein [Lacipirellulaceae bacterium]
MIRSLVFASAALAAATCQATILSQLTLTWTTAAEPTSVASGAFGTFAVSGITDIHSQSPFVANTDYYVPFGELQTMNDMIAHPENYDAHGPVFATIQGAGLGSYQPHYSYLGQNVTDNSCTIGQGPCVGTLTIAGTPQVYTVPWNEVKFNYTYAPAAGAGFITSMVVTISNVPEPASALLVGVGMIAAPIFGSRRRR